MTNKEMARYYDSLPPNDVVPRIVEIKKGSMITMGRVELTPVQNDNERQFLIGRDLMLTVDGNAIDWMLIEGIEIKIAPMAPVRFVINFTPIP